MESQFLKFSTLFRYLVEGLEQVYDIDESSRLVAQKLFGISLLCKVLSNFRELIKLFLVLVTWMNFFELDRFAARFQILATIAKLLSCALIILTGFYFYLFKGWNESLEEPMKNSNYSTGSLFMSLYGGLYAFSGWYVV